MSGGALLPAAADGSALTPLGWSRCWWRRCCSGLTPRRLPRWSNDSRRRERQRLSSRNWRSSTAAASFAASRLDIRDFERASNVIRNDQERLQRQLARLASGGVLEAYAGRAGALRGAWKGGQLTMDQRRAVVSAVLGKVEIMPARRRGQPSFDSTRVRVATPQSPSG